MVAGLRLGGAPTIMTNITVPPSTALPIPLPAGAAGDVLELRLNVSSAETAKGRVGLSVRATNGTKPAEQTLITFVSSTYGGVQQQQQQQQQQQEVADSQSTAITEGVVAGQGPIPPAPEAVRTGLQVVTTSADVHARPVNLVAVYPDDELVQPSPRSPSPAPEQPQQPPQQQYSLRVLVDRSVIEAHVNARLSVTSRAYPLQADKATHAYVINQSPSHAVVVDSVEAWGLRSIWKT
eukprot:COSAG01_NODE_3796_length_5688_cov_4.251208_2_plen_237_part_00